MTIGEKIKAIRRHKKISQDDIQQTSGIPRNYLSLIENNRRGLSVHTLERIAQALSVSVGYITDYEADSIYTDAQPESRFRIAEDEPPEPANMVRLSLVPIVSERSLELAFREPPTPTGWIQIPSRWIPQAAGQYCAMWIERPEQCLPPTIEVGSLVCLDIAQKDPYALQGKLAAFWIERKCLIRRLQIQGNNIIGIADTCNNQNSLLILPLIQKRAIIGRVCCYLGAPA